MLCVQGFLYIWLFSWLLAYFYLHRPRWVMSFVLHFSLPFLLLPLHPFLVRAYHLGGVAEVFTILGPILPALNLYVALIWYLENN